MNKLKKILSTLCDLLPHINLALAFTLIACFITDRYNRAMSFINNDITKWMLFVFCVLNVVEGIVFIRWRRNR
ncbi:MAG: hypothetical protein GX061_03390 [Eubacteriaceae bacterium]|nr:hypothetical protein [Eubacteriaceae bacterium]